MEKFEYKTIKRTLSFEEQLNKLGDEGWELVNIEYQTDLVYLKRKKEKILCDIKFKIVSTHLLKFGSYADQCREIIAEEYELIDIIRNENGDYWAHLGKYEYE